MGAKTVFNGVAGRSGSLRRGDTLVAAVAAHPAGAPYPRCCANRQVGIFPAKHRPARVAGCFFVAVPGEVLLKGRTP